MNFSPFASAFARRFAIPALLAIGANASWAQDAHPQHVAAADAAPAAPANTSKPMVRKPRPQLAVGATFAPDGTLWLVGVNANNQMFVQSAPPPTGASTYQWSAPRVIDTADDGFSADGENRPQLAFGPNGWVVVSYAKPLEKRFTGMIRMVRSEDGGRTFSAPFTVHQDQQEIAHSFQASAFDAKGVLHTFWLDKRDGERAPKVGEKSSYTGSAVYRNESLDGGKTFGPDLKLADHSCECCRIASALDHDGTPLFMWRHVYAPNERDHALARLATDGTPASVQRATFDRWKVDGCPHHGPSLVVDGAGVRHAVWFNQKDGEGRVFYGRLLPGAEIRVEGQRPVGGPRAAHADLATAGGKLAIVWKEFDGERTQLRGLISGDGGQRFDELQLAATDGASDQPRVIRRQDKLYAFWRTEKEGFRVLVLP